MQKQKTTLVSCVFGDMHDPYVNAVIFEYLFLPFVKSLRPNIIIESGDGFDFYGISRFLKQPRRRMQMSRERNLFVARREQLQKVLPRDCRKVYLRGNHEDRMYKYLIRQAPEIMDEIYWADYLKLDKLGWDVVDDGNSEEPAESFFELGSLLVMHGEVARKQPGVAPKALLDSYNENVLTNHTHKVGSSSARFYRGRIILGYENGCMCDIPKVSRDYVQMVANWINCWSVVFTDVSTGRSHVEQFVVTIDKTDYNVFSPKKDVIMSAAVGSPVKLNLSDFLSEED